MIYSVWNQGKNAYDYYETAEVAERLNAPAPKHVPTGRLGATPEKAAWPLPKDARPVGSGVAAQGRVASVESRNGIGTLGYAVIGGLGYALWRSLK
jgi:hypothetical protein